MAYTNTDFAAFQQMRRINPSKYHNQKTRKAMNKTYRDVGLSEFFGIDTDDLTPVTEAECTMDLPELIILAGDRLEAGDLLFNELTDTTLGCLYATGGLPIHRAAANGEAHKIKIAVSNTDLTRRLHKRIVTATEDQGDAVKAVYAEVHRQGQMLQDQLGDVRHKVECHID